jgi:GAF domain-containing protein/DNA-binding CsgD family transcriptional regulator
LLAPSTFRDALGFVVIVPLLWAAVRKGPRDTATVSLIVSIFAAWGTLLECGPFAESSEDGLYVVLLIFVISISVPALALSAEVAARQRIEKKDKQRALESAVLWQATLQASTGGSLDELLHDCLKQICRVAGWGAAHVYLPDDPDDPKILLSASVWHFERDVLPAASLEKIGVDRKRGQGLPGRIWSTGKPVWVPDISKCDQPDRKHILLENGYKAAFGFPVFSEGKLLAILEFFTNERRQPDCNLLCIVQSIGEQLGRVIERKRAQDQEAAMHTAMDALTLAIYFTDGNGRIVYLNRAASQQIEAHRGFYVEQGRLIPSSEAVRPIFRHALRAAAAHSLDPEARNMIVPLPIKEDGGLIAVVLSLAGGELRSLNETAVAAVAILVQDASTATLSTAAAFAELYGLTDGELRLLRAMAPDTSLKDTAGCLGVSEATVKTHLQHIFGKTHTSKQSELLALLSRYTPPLDLQ